MHDYQELARDFLRKNPRAGLLLDCGYGKTRVVLEALEPRHLPALVVAPKRVAENVWGPERDLWRPDLDMGFAIGSASDRLIAINARAGVTVVGRDNLKDVTGRYATVIFDELSGYKTKSSVRWKQGRRLAKDAANVWGLTGTPSPNGLMDLFGQVALLDGGQRFGLNIQNFRYRYFLPGRRLPTGTIIEWKITDDGEAAIKRAIEDLMLSITDKIKLPPLTYNRIPVDIPSKVRVAYLEFQKELIVDLEMLGGDVHTAANTAVLTGKLSQLTAGFLYRDVRQEGHDWLHDEKIDAIEAIRNETSDNLMVYYRFGAEREALHARFPDAVHISAPGAIQTWQRGEISMLLAHPASAAHGLNLQHGGHTIIWMTLDWSLEIWHQANARLYRQGQTQPVIIHIVEAANTIDRFILKRIHGKQGSQDSLIEHLSSPL